MKDLVANLAVDTRSLLDRRSLVLGACGASAGAHAGLIPEHLREEPLYGYAFIGATLLMCLAAYVVMRWPERLWPTRVAAGAFASLLIAYAVTRLNEAVDPFGIVVKVVEIVGLVLVLRLAPAPRDDEREAVDVVVIGLAVVLFLSLAAGGAHAHGG